MLRPRGNPTTHRRWFAIALCLLGELALAPAIHGAESTERGQLLSSEGKVQFSRKRADWSAVSARQKLETEDRLRTLALSRALAQLAELGRVRLDELTTLEILPPRTSQSKGTLDLKSGALYFFTRDRPREFEIRTPQALAASRGTEFSVTLDATGRELFTVFDGEVDLTNSLGGVVLVRGEQGVVDPGQPPRKTAVIEATRLVQWWLYYSPVLDLTELSLSPAQKQALADSLAAYRQGDLLQALESFPEGRSPENEDENVLHAALLLSVGQVAKADALLNATNVSTTASALRSMINIVQSRDVELIAQPRTATEWLANSYILQSRFKLDEALDSARKATQQSPEFGFAWSRVAELEFSFGQTDAASAALDRALELSPRNAQAWALKGFLLSAKRKWKEAEQAFDKAIALDPALGNGWLGRGLLKIRSGDRAGGREDLQTAAALEPNRSLLRSYLGKSFDHAHDDINAARELALAQQLDARDPTPWLYSALILREELRYNAAVDDLEKSVALNDDRRVYRSRLLLDQDQAVRSASLATIYRSAGMDDVSVREAARAVTYDYANHSAHQFLAESYDALRDPTRFNLRIETAWFNELLLANLLAPVGAGNLSQNISQQEYSRLFEADRLGFSSTTEYRSDGQVRELASQFGTAGHFSYALDLDYQHNEGVRPNNELERAEFYTTAKYQLTTQDSLFVLAKFQDYHSGDNFQYYDPAKPGTIRTNFFFDEYQHPLLALAWHREWIPGVHTLLLGSRLANDQRFGDKGVNQLVLQTNSTGQVIGASELGLDSTGNDLGGMDVTYRGEFDAYSAELNQIFQTERNTLVLGGRFQTGEFQTHNLMTNVQPPGLAPFFVNPPGDAEVESDFNRASAYGYYTFEPLEKLWLTAGVAYDHLEFPINHRSPPVSSEADTRDRVNPKAALVWSPLPEVTLRGIYAHSLGGVTLDESFRLEPTQLGGFVQSFRTVIPESVVGSVSAPTFDVAGGALDLKFKSRTFVGVQGQLLKSEVRDEIGVFAFETSPPANNSVAPASTSRHLDYQEPSAAVTVNQLLGESWSLGAQYRFTRAELRTVLPEIPTTVFAGADRTEQASLHQATFFAMLNHRSGFFARAESQWYHQNNSGYTPALASEDFWQHNIEVGYRLKRQRGEISLGVLNLTDVDYHLNPLSAYSELPRERVFMVRLKINL